MKSKLNGLNTSKDRAVYTHTYHDTSPHIAVGTIPSITIVNLLYIDFVVVYVPKIPLMNKINPIPPKKILFCSLVINLNNLPIFSESCKILNPTMMLIMLYKSRMNLVSALDKHNTNS